MRWLPVLVAAVAGCASAKVDNGNQPADGNDPGQDSAEPKDAGIDSPPPIDAAPVAVTLGQTTSTAILAGNSFNCNQGNVTRENSYYRVFALTDHGINTA